MLLYMEASISVYRFIRFLSMILKNMFIDVDIANRGSMWYDTIKNKSRSYRLIVSHFEQLRRHKSYKEKRNLPLRVISDETGLSQGTILRVKNATMARISLSTVESLCRYFDAKSLSELIEYVPDQPTE